MKAMPPERRPAAMLPLAVLLLPACVSVALAQPSPGAAGADSARGEPGPEPLSLQAVVQEALAANPEIAEARALWQAAEAGVPAAGALPDPVLELMLDEQPLDGGTGMRVVSLTQELMLFGKRGAMTREAQGEAAAARQMARDMVRRVVTEVKVAYFDLFRLERQLEAMRQSHEALVTAVEATRARYEAGEAGQQELLLGQVELSALEGEIARDEAMAQAARAGLNLLLAREATAPLGSPQVAGLSVFAEGLDDLVARGRASRPQVLARERELEAAEAGAGFARVAARPDLMLRGGYMRMPEGENAIQAAVGITLPVWKGRKQDALARQAERRVEAARSGVAAERNRAGMEIADEYARLLASRELARRYEEEILPLADMAFASARAAYVSGQEDFPVLLETVRRLTELRRTHAQYLAEAEIRLARLEQAVGQDLGAVQIGPEAGLSQQEEGGK